MNNLKKSAKGINIFNPIFVSSIAETPVNVKHNWEQRISIKITGNEWKQYFTIPHNVKISKKLRNFNSKDV